MILEPKPVANDTVSKRGFAAPSKFRIGDKVRMYVDGTYFARGRVTILRPYGNQDCNMVKMSNGKSVIIREENCEAWND